MMDIFGWTKADLAAYYARKANQTQDRGRSHAHAGEEGIVNGSSPTGVPPT